MNVKKQEVIDQPENKDNSSLLDRLNREAEEYQVQVKMLQKELDQRFSEIATLTQILLEKDKLIAELERHQVKNIPGVRYIKGPLRFIVKLLRLK